MVSINSEVMMKTKVMTVFISILLIGSCTANQMQSIEKQSESEERKPLLAESFIIEHLLLKDGRIGTDLVNQKNVFLSETVGLWMEYLLLQNNLVLFDQQVKALKKYFLSKDYLVTWELQGRNKAPANAFIDDLRIIEALYKGSELWGKTDYSDLAEKMSENIVKYQVKSNMFVDFVDIKSKYKSDYITMSYIIPTGIEQLVLHEKISKDMESEIKKILINAPVNEMGFLPKTYFVNSKKYQFDTEVNLIDQFYVGYHQALWGGNVEPLLQFAKKEFYRNNGILFGRYELESGQPLVDFEGVSVYALAILMSIEIGENEFAIDLFRRMKEFQQSDIDKMYYGGYVDLPTLDTHTFDNLLALIAERKGIDEGIFKN